MASSSKKVRNFQIDFLRFLSEKKIPEVHIYYHVINYWSNDQSVISLVELKDAITDLCNQKLIISKGNAHTLIGAQGVPEEDQKNDAICIIEEAGRKYLKKFELGRNIKKSVVVLLIAAVLFSIWHYRTFSYFFS
jgi:hypothetical protein